MTIGIFDSGIGGMSVLHEAMHYLPNEKFIFYADTDNVPYGIKTPDEIRSYADEITEFLIDEGADAVAIACNTATSVAVDYLREKYKLPIIGMEPAVKPAVREAEDKDSGRVLVMATPVTIREKKLHTLIDRVDEHHIVDLLPMPELVEFAEREEFDGPGVEAYLKSRFESLEDTGYSVMVLGCTHFNYFKPLYKKFFDDNLKIIDGNKGTVRRIADVLDLIIDPDGSVDNYKKANVQYYLSGRRVSDDETLKLFSRLHSKLEEVRCIY